MCYLRILKVVSSTILAICLTTVLAIIALDRLVPNRRILHSILDQLEASPPPHDYLGRTMYHAPPPDPLSELASTLEQLLWPTYASGPHSRGVSCARYVLLAGEDGVASCLAQLSKYPANRFEVANRYRGGKPKAVCRRRNAEGVETRLELNIDASHPDALWRREVRKWEIVCALRRRLRECAPDLVEEPGEECELRTWTGDVHVVFGVE